MLRASLLLAVLLHVTVATSFAAEPLSLKPGESQNFAGCKLTRTVLHGGKQEGVELLTLNNGQLEITLIPTRGMSILAVREMAQDGTWNRALGWDSPVKQVVHPQYVDLDTRGGLGWLDGFNEWMVRCGLEFAGHPGKDVFTDNTGATAEMNLTLHGKAGNIPALNIETETVNGQLIVRGFVYEQMFFGPKFKLAAELSTAAHSESFTIRDVITNEGSAPQEMMLLYHCNFGAPLLEEGARVVVAADRISPMNEHAAKSVDDYAIYDKPTAGFIEQVYLVHPRSNKEGQTSALIKNAAGSRGCSLTWSTAQLPYLTLWKNTVAEQDGYVTGLEPGTCFPHNRQEERQAGRVLQLTPGTPYEFAVQVTVHSSTESVEQAEASIIELQGSKPAQLDGAPVEHTAAATTTSDSIEPKFLANVRQVTHNFPRAGEGYFSPDDQHIVYQAYPTGYPFYQIYVQDLIGGPPRRISPGRGRTTCAYFSRDGQRILYASAHTDPHLDQTEAQARELAAAGGRRRYEWDFDPHMEIYECNLDGTSLKALTNTLGYDAEGSYSHDGKQIVFTSSRDGDPDLYIMDANGENVRQITNVDGYDGGPFFSPDDQWIIFRSDRQQEHMLQLFAISADGKREVQLTDDLNTVNWAPYFHPSGKYLVWTRADYSQGPTGANFDLLTMELDLEDGILTGGDVNRITDHAKADVLPVFSNDGKQLLWTSSRTEDGSSQLWIADWLRTE